MEAKLKSLRLDPPKRKSSAGAERAVAGTGVADSWEDEADGDVEAPTGLSLRRVGSDGAGTCPPPPTPIHSEAGSRYDWSAAGVLGGGRPQPLGSQAEADSERRRPEKSTAAAGRMIAASLGIKAPKKTEEQRQYERAVREQEIKRKNREKEAREREREEDEKAKAAVWDG
ncbi:hypothetical protein DV737_g3738, partial [Chaetothyriales sp. CBS 132003]